MTIIRKDLTPEIKSSNQFDNMNHRVCITGSTLGSDLVDVKYKGDRLMSEAQAEELAQQKQQALPSYNIVIIKFA